MAKRILVIDDDPGILDAVSLILTDSGYQVEILLKADKAYEKVAVFKPDLILLDVLMSGNDGREICKNLKTDSETKNIPIVLTSAHPDVSSYAKNYQADGFLAKPFDIDVLLDTVKKKMKPNN